MLQARAFVTVTAGSPKQPVGSDQMSLSKKTVTLRD
jgi:hypothetical protein